MAGITSVSMNLLQPRSQEPTIIAFPALPPYTNNYLTANLVLRVFFAIVANLVCLVPLRLLHRNGEFAAVVFIITVEVQNLGTVVNSLVWRDDNIQEWYPGYGLCDLGSYVDNFIDGLYSTCLLAIVRNLAQQVGLLRANALTGREKRRRNMIQALIMFPLPLVQVIMTWPLTAQRYAIGTFIGCRWVGHGSWPYLVFFIAPFMLVPLATAAYAVLIYFRFREVARTTQSALHGNRVANNRAQRTRRRLYLMVISILTPFLPIHILLFVWNLYTLGGVKSFNYNEIHNHTSPFPWNSIYYITSDRIDFGHMNLAYLSVFTAIPIFVFFGMTKDAMNDYRRILLCCGFGRFFPRLYHEYDPDRIADEERSGSLGAGQFTSSSVVSPPKDFSARRLFGSFSSTSGQSSQSQNQLHSIDFLTSPEQEQGQMGVLNIPRSPTPAYTPPHTTATTSELLPHRNPFMFRTTFELPTASFTLPFFKKHSSSQRSISNDAQDEMPLEPLPSRWSNGIHTRVWSDEEARLCSSGNSHNANVNHHSPRSVNEGHNIDPLETRSPRSSSAQGSGVVIKTMLTRETSVAQSSLYRQH